MTDALRIKNGTEAASQNENGLAGSPTWYKTSVVFVSLLAARLVGRPDAILIDMIRKPYDIALLQ